MNLTDYRTHRFGWHLPNWQLKQKHTVFLCFYPCLFTRFVLSYVDNDKNHFSFGILNSSAIFLVRNSILLSLCYQKNFNSQALFTSRTNNKILLCHSRKDEKWKISSKNSDSPCLGNSYLQEKGENPNKANMLTNVIYLEVGFFQKIN